jgi:CheY-specific phosphatase CheX
MFASAFSGERSVLQAATGVEALVDAAKAQPAVIFIGSDIGRLAGDLLIRKLRTHRNLQQTKIVAIQSRLSTRRWQGACATIVRSFGAQSFRAQIEGLFGPRLPAGGALVVQAELRTLLASACEQVLGMMAGFDIEPCVNEGSPVPAGAIAVTQLVDLTERNERLSFTLYLDEPSATRVAATLRSIPVGEVTPDQTESACGEASNLITGRLKAWLESSGTIVQCSAPVFARTEEPRTGPVCNSVVAGCHTTTPDVVCVATLTALGAVSVPAPATQIDPARRELAEPGGRVTIELPTR